MPVQIGAKLHDFSNPMGLLTDCHGRIKQFLGTLEAVAKELDRPYREETARALATALQYFKHAAPKHNADEEESLFPRLRRLQHAVETQAMLAQLEELESEHEWAAPLHAELDRLGAQYLASQAPLAPAEAEKFRGQVAQLAAMYRQHIHIEDVLVFPAADRLLPPGERAAIAQEMSARRNLKPGLPIAPGPEKE